ncbi:peptidase M16 [Vibrio sp. SM6]|uniref:Protease 3 n=2 Tax=Vibrio agarilyticus TaxID=2726741 RepID=A0A7X8YFZ4_9VIBR|nr:peptidase M16 [Vibrio agarilyticus]
MVMFLGGCGGQWADNSQQKAVAEPKPLAVIATSPNDERAYRTLTLDNGIDVLLVSDPDSDKSSAALNVGVGLLQDPPEQQGMAHYLEHLLFLGTEKYPDPNEYKQFLTENGGISNASTWLTYTNYMFKVNNEAFEPALDRFSDFFKSPIFSEKYSDKERSAVNAEWSMRRELDFFGQFKLSRKMMGSHPANRFLIGNNETLSDKPGSNLHQATQAFYHDYYSANIMKVALISPLPLDDMAQLAREYFGSIKNKQIDKPAVTSDINFAELGGRKIYYKPNKDVKQIKLDFVIENNQHEFAYKPNVFVTYLLGSEMPGTPTQLLKSRGWISSAVAGASPNFFGNYGELSITIDLTDAGMLHREEIVALYMQYIAIIKARGVDKMYFDEIQTVLANDFRFLAKEDDFRYAARLVNAMQDYPLNYAISAPYYYGAFNADAVHHVLSQLRRDRLRVWYISQQERVAKKQHFYAGQYRIEPLSAKEVASWQQHDPALTLPKVNRLLPHEFALKSVATSSSLPQKIDNTHDVEIWFFPSQHFSSEPKGILTLEFNMGKASRSSINQVALALWSDMYQLHHSLLLAEAEAAGISASTSVENGLELEMDGFTDKQITLFDTLVGELNPTMSQANFEQAKDRYIRGIKNQQKQFVMYQLFPAMRKVVRAAQHENSALIKAAEQLSFEQYQQRIATLLAHNQPRLLAFGNYDEQDLAQYARIIDTALGANHETLEDVQTQWYVPKGVISYQQNTAAADIGLLDIMFHPQPSLKQRAIAKVFAVHFGTEVFEQLRTEEQLAYAVGGFDLPMDSYAGMAMYIQSPVLSLPQAQARFDRFKREYGAKLADLSEQQFSAIKQGVLVDLNQAPKNLGEELRPLLQDWYGREWQFDSKAKLIEAVEAVTLADLNAFYQQTIANEQAPRLNVQLRGGNFADAPFAKLDDAQIVHDIQILKGQLSYQE